MKKSLVLTLTLALALSLSACGRGGGPKESPAPDATPAAGDELKTGFAVISSAEKSAENETGGVAQADSTFAAVLVDKDGKITDAYIDAVQTKIAFDQAGKITTPLDTMVQTKSELGAEYGMAKASSIKKEWNEQIAAFTEYVKGKTISEVKGIAVTDKGAPSAADLSTSVTMSIGGYVAVLEKAVANAKSMGAKAGDTVGAGAVTNIAKSKSAEGSEDGLAQAYSSYTAASFGAGGVITSCIIDGSQTNINISSQGKITSDIKAVQKTKTELGDAYGMKKASSLGTEWFEQAKALSEYVTGKTIAEVKSIKINEKTVPTEEDLKSSVTISIGDYTAALEKAANAAK